MNEILEKMFTRWNETSDEKLKKECCLALIGLIPSMFVGSHSVLNMPEFALKHAFYPKHEFIEECVKIYKENC